MAFKLLNCGQSKIAITSVQWQIFASFDTRLVYIVFFLTSNLISNHKQTIINNQFMHLPFTAGEDTMASGPTVNGT